MSRYRLALPATIATLAMLVPGGPVHADARSASAAIALHLKDLPQGYLQTTSAVSSNAVLAQQTGLTVATLAAHGRITGYATAFVHSSHGPPTTVQDRVGAYKAAAGAKWGYGYQTAAL